LIEILSIRAAKKDDETEQAHQQKCRQGVWAAHRVEDSRAEQIRGGQACEEREDEYA
jgi:hypothetical protein